MKALLFIVGFIVPVALGTSNPPINDECTSALLIGSTATEREAMLQNDIRQTGLVIPIDNREATLEAALWANGQTSTGQCNEGGIARPNSTSYKQGTGVTHDIWYTFTGYETGRLSLSTCGLTTWHSVLSVYEGGVEGCESIVNNRGSEFNCVAIDYYTATDSICARHLNAGADVYLEVRPGDTFLIRVSTVDGVGEGTMQVKFEPAFPSPPDCSSSSLVQCHNGGTCDQENQCVCPTGYFGTRCQHSAGCDAVEEGEETVLCETYQGGEELAVTLATNHKYNRGDVSSKLTTCGQYGAMLGIFTVNDELSVAVNRDILPKGTYRVIGHVLAIDSYSGSSEIGVKVNHGIGEKYRTEASSSHPTFNEIDTNRNGWKHGNQCGDSTNYCRLFGNTEIELLVDFRFTLPADLHTATTPLEMTLFNYGTDEKFGLLSLVVHGPATIPEISSFGARSNGYCLRPDGADQNSGVIKAEGSDYWSDTQCLQWCELQQQDTTTTTTACEFIWDQSNRGCYQHTQPVGSANGVDRHYCWIVDSTSSKHSGDTTKYTTQSSTTTKEDNTTILVFNVSTLAVFVVGIAVVVALTILVVKRRTTQQPPTDAGPTEIPV